MKLFKDTNGIVYSYPLDGSQDDLIGNKVAITQKEADAITQAKFAALGIPVIPAYVSQRVASYPSIGDQLDALWKGGAEADAMKAKIQAVKTKYPKA